jgi:predicted porin
MYAAGPISASAAYESHKLNAVTAAGGLNGTAIDSDVKESAFKIGGGYTMDQFTVNAVYEKTSDSNLTAKRDHSALYLAGKFNVSATDAVKAAYTSAGKVGGVANTEATQISVGYDHMLSKRTTIYALYTSVSNKSMANYGLATTSTSGFATSSGVDKDPNAFAVGLKHSF